MYYDIFMDKNERVPRSIVVSFSYSLFVSYFVNCLSVCNRIKPVSLRNNINVEKAKIRVIFWESELYQRIKKVDKVSFVLRFL